CSIKVVIAILFLLIPQLVAAHFVNVKHTMTNIRCGPGLYYPVKLIILKRDIPLEVISNFEDWYEICDFEGNIGWIHRSLVNNRRYALIKADGYGYTKPGKNSKKVLKIDRGVSIYIKKCKQDFCHASVKNLTFWIEKNQLWGIE